MVLATYFDPHGNKVETAKREGCRRQKRHWNKLPNNGYLSCNDNNNMYHGRRRERREMHWEEKYCLINGIHWKKLLDTKKYLHQYADITGWDDSAGKEAFDNAKARYWAHINGMLSEIPLPDPDVMMETVYDHEVPLSIQKIYENLHGSVSDNEADFDDCCDLWGEGGVVLWDLHYAKEEEEMIWVQISTGLGDSQPIKPTGWGDNDPLNHTTYERIIPTGWGENG